MAEEKNKESDAYKVISDEFDASIPKDHYVLEGKVLHVKSKRSIKSFQIHLQTGVDYNMKKGVFKLQLKTNDGWVQFLKENYQGGYFENYELKSQHRIKVEIYMNEEDRSPQIREEKPVIYAYNDTEINFELKLKSKGELTFSYPQLHSSNIWKMKTSANGNLISNSGEEFPYLFWEAKQNLFINLAKEKNVYTAQIVRKKDVVHFLDSSLTLLNLNATEKTDFITYWGPRLVQHEFCFVQFLVQDACEQFASYEVSPKPINFNRLYLVYSGVNHYPSEIQCKSQILKPFDRSGFQLLEWGGIEYSYENIIIEESNNN